MKVPADKQIGEAAEIPDPYMAMSLTHLKLHISERFRGAKETWHAVRNHHGAIEIPTPPPKKSMLDRAMNEWARTAAQIRTGHWRSSVDLRRIRRPGHVHDKGWFSDGAAKITRSHVLLRCRTPNSRRQGWRRGRDRTAGVSACF